jgi:hypothetical protein
MSSTLPNKPARSKSLWRPDYIVSDLNQSVTDLNSVSWTPAAWFLRDADAVNDSGRL